MSSPFDPWDRPSSAPSSANDPFGGGIVPSPAPYASIVSNDPFGTPQTFPGTGAPGGYATTRQSLQIHSAPVWILGVCVLVTALAAVATWISGVVAVAFVSWAVAGPVGAGLLAVFQSQDARAQSRGAYSRQSWVTPAFAVAVVLTLGAVTVCAFRIAMWAGRL